MESVISNAAAILFALGGLLGLISIVTREGPILLAVGLLVACIGGLVLALG